MQKQDFETYQKCFRDFAILPKFSKTHVFRGTIRHPSYSRSKDQRRNIFKKASVIPTAPTITTTTHKYIQLQREKKKEQKQQGEGQVRFHTAFYLFVYQAYYKYAPPPRIYETLPHSSNYLKHVHRSLSPTPQSVTE